MKCNYCPVNCGALRPLTVGACGAGKLKIAKYSLFKFEEPPVSFDKGSGCVFFCGCSLRCVFCQNYEISHKAAGREISVNKLADIFKELEDMGADNINLVNPTHYLKDIMGAIEIYRPKIPIIYNTHGYERADALKLAAQFVDVWLTDLKFIDPVLSKRYTGKENYAQYALPAIKFMSEKPLEFSEEGKMLSGCIIRHLVLPQAVYDTKKVIQEVAKFNDGVYFSLMSQYTPHGNVEKFKELNRKITKREYNSAVDAVFAAGLKNVFIQDFSSAEEGYIPEWDF